MQSESWSTVNTTSSIDCIANEIMAIQISYLHLSLFLISAVISLAFTKRVLHLLCKSQKSTSVGWWYRAMRLHQMQKFHTWSRRSSSKESSNWCITSCSVWLRGIRYATLFVKVCRIQNEICWSPLYYCVSPNIHQHCSRVVVMGSSENILRLVLQSLHSGSLSSKFHNSWVAQARYSTFLPVLTS